MSANALETMIVPIVRGLFLVIMLGAGGIGLMRMLGAIASSAKLPPDESVIGPNDASRPSRPTPPAEVDRILAEEDLATAAI